MQTVAKPVAKPPFWFPRNCTDSLRTLFLHYVWICMFLLLVVRSCYGPKLRLAQNILQPRSYVEAPEAQPSSANVLHAPPQMERLHWENPHRPHPLDTCRYQLPPPKQTSPAAMDNITETPWLMPPFPKIRVIGFKLCMTGVQNLKVSKYSWI